MLGAATYLMLVLPMVYGSYVDCNNDDARQIRVFINGINTNRCVDRLWICTNFNYYLLEVPFDEKLPRAVELLTRTVENFQPGVETITINDRVTPVPDYLAAIALEHARPDLVCQGIIEGDGAGTVTRLYLEYGGDNGVLRATRVNTWYRDCDNADVQVHVFIDAVNTMRCVSRLQICTNFQYHLLEGPDGEKLQRAVDLLRRTVERFQPGVEGITINNGLSVTDYGRAIQLHERPDLVCQGHIEAPALTELHLRIGGDHRRESGYRAKTEI